MKQKGVIGVSKDIDKVTVILELAEISFDEGSYDGVTEYLELSNGLKIYFYGDGSLMSFELP